MLTTTPSTAGTEIQTSARDLSLGLAGRTLSPTPIGTRNLSLVVPLNQVPLEDSLAAVAADPPGVKVLASERFPVVLTKHSAAHQRPRIHISLQNITRSRLAFTSEATIRPATPADQGSAGER